MTGKTLESNEPTGCVNTPPALTTTAFVAKGHVMADAHTTLEWHPIPGYPGYFVTRCGQVHGPRCQLRPWPTERGYLRVGLRGGKQRFACVHRLVLLTFAGPCPDGMEACHNDGNPGNNHIDNLRWDTPKSNQRDRFKHGTDSRGNKHGHSRLTEDDVLAIRQMLKDGQSFAEVARQFDYSETAIARIANGQTWSHVGKVAAAEVEQGATALVQLRKSQSAPVPDGATTVYAIKHANGTFTIGFS